MFYLYCLYLFVVGVLSLFGLHQFILVGIAYRRRKLAPVAAAPAPAEWPFVTVQIPVFNERVVVERIVAAAGAFDYPVERWEIQILDDSTDDTQELSRHAVLAAQRRGVPIHYLHRTHRTGYKAGALAEGLASAKGELIAIFDADFVPAPNFLRRVVPEFFRAGSERVAFVQTRWSYLNREENLLTRVQATMHDSHFFVEQPVRNALGLPFNFNGSGGIWRRASIDAVGGWQMDTLTEDLDLSYRANLAGWHGVYVGEIPAPNELPASLLAFKRQQVRWARGSIQTARKLMGRVWNSPVRLLHKLSASLHLTAYGLHPTLLVFTLLWPLLLMEPFWFPGHSLRIPFWLNFLSPLSLSFIFGMLLAHRLQGLSWREAGKNLFFSILIGMGLCFSNTIAVFQGLFIRQTGEFERTPKTATAAPVTRYRLRLRWTVVGETVLGFYQLTGSLLLLREKQFVGAISAAFYASAFFFFVGLQVREVWQHRAPAPTIAPAPALQTNSNA